MISVGLATVKVLRKYAVTIRLLVGPVSSSVASSPSPKPNWPRPCFHPESLYVGERHAVPRPVRLSL